MKGSRVLVCPINFELPDIEAPFVVLIDADDTAWSDIRSIRRLAKNLLAAGCRYFVCFGRRSEMIHDFLDDVVLDEGYHGVTTTFHEDETKEDVIGFLINCATIDMKGALVFVQNTLAWEIYL